jgi:hypothetical protein
VRIPIACTLTPEAAGDRLEEWRRFAARSTGSPERLTRHEVRVRLDPSPGTLEAAVDLARREKACCAFFEFSIQIQADALWLTASVPPEASATLDEFASLFSRPS